MTEPGFTICQSDTPASLAGSVNQHLQEGWELHGHPFVYKGPVFCQALITGAAAIDEAAATEIVLTPLVAPRAKKKAAARPVASRGIVPRAARPRVEVTFGNLAAFLAVCVVPYLLIEAFLFRTALYARYIEPVSSAGDFERNVRDELLRAPTGKKEMLLVGSSRIVENFSAKLANERKPDDGYFFTNGAVLHAGPRDWYYYVREVDPHRNRYKAILIPIDDYDDPDVADDVPERIVDLRICITRLRLLDILPFGFSFRTWPGRFEALRGASLKGLVYQRDFQEFLEDPAARLEKAEAWRTSGFSYINDYGGIQHKLTGLAVDWKERRVTGLPADNQDPDWLPLYRQGIFDNTPQNGIARAEQVRWITALIELYRGSQTRFVVYQVPRGPAMPPYPRAHYPWTTVDVLSKLPNVTIADRHRFESIEKPELFGDLLHLNSDGRAQFTPMLVTLAKEIVR